jgi:hypothetical protein
MGKTRRMHQFGDADPLKSALPEELRRRGDDPALVLFRLGSADFHGHSPAGLDKMMMLILI